MHNFRSDYVVECLKVKSTIFAYRKIKYNKLKSEIRPKIQTFESMINNILFHLTIKPQTKIMPVFIHSLVLTLHDISVSLLFKIFEVKYNISDLKKDLEKDLEKDFRSCVGFLCWFLTMD